MHEKVNNFSKTIIIKEKLKQFSGAENVNPSIFNINPENAIGVYKEFEDRLLKETDIAVVVDGVISPRGLFDPTVPLRRLETRAGPAEIKIRSRLYKIMVDKMFHLLCGNQVKAYINHQTRKISVTPELDRFSTVAAIARGNFTNVLGPQLAHEALHVHHANKEEFSIAGIHKILKEISIHRQTDRQLSISKASQMICSSSDATLLREAQAFVFMFSLTGGADEEALPDNIVEIKSMLKNIQSGHLPIRIDNLGINEEERSRITQYGQQHLKNQKFNGIPLYRYSENGYASILDLVLKETKLYLPRPYQDDKNYLKRIESATLQIIRLLNIGVSHQAIADLIRNNHESTHSGVEWDENSKKYKFLQQSIDQHPNNNKMDDTALVEKFNIQMENRVIKMRNIAVEVLTNN